MTTTPEKYIGRFAPSPTGKLHFGSLVTALASYLRARSKGGKWFLRIEDVDTTRIEKGAIHSILTTLEDYGFQWDDEIIFQSKRSDIYQDYLGILKTKNLIFNCICTRREISKNKKNTLSGEYVYGGKCRELHNPSRLKHAKRIKTFEERITFHDLLRGKLRQNIAEDVGDFIVWRSENFASYQLAVVIDDHLQGITEVVRGSDLYLQTPRQIYLQKCLNFMTPIYAHIPVVLNEFGQKLSKQTKANPILKENARDNLISALNYLGFDYGTQNKIIEISRNNNEILENAARYFNLKNTKF
ncbi:tRNA glutamyl-Q(34) synthetase GluQRS [Fluviispira vulneris]|uniref:tRNA glutamyl-Q(34) synthetase GluQRS n=1 Tax=Fluviispira vulneris TaxID=2763012 RepID=UPI00164698DE|nr:tRNA glutamyl-Q(34) synthetase GluQRS [Fluviispira vulneris]